MSNGLSKVFWPILKHFETDQEPANYKKSHRVALIPVVVFAALGVVAVVIGALGSNGAVSKIWGTEK